MGVCEMGFSLFAMNEGFMDDVEVAKVLSFEAAMWAYVKSNNADLVAKIEESGDYNNDIAAEMKAAVEAFKANGVW